MADGMETGKDGAGGLTVRCDHLIAATREVYIVTEPDGTMRSVIRNLANPQNSRCDCNGFRVKGTCPHLEAVRARGGQWYDFLAQIRADAVVAALQPGRIVYRSPLWTIRAGQRVRQVPSGVYLRKAGLRQVEANHWTLPRCEP